MQVAVNVYRPSQKLCIPHRLIRRTEGTTMPVLYLRMRL